MNNATIKVCKIACFLACEADVLAVLDQCALERDLTLFEAGDKTEVGEKGMTLSGGQKVRM